MKKNILRIVAFGLACFTFIFLIFALTVDSKDGQTAMKALSLIFTLGTIICLVLEEIFKRRKENKVVSEIDNTPPESPFVPTPEPETQAEPKKPDQPLPTEIVR